MGGVFSFPPHLQAVILLCWGHTQISAERCLISESRGMRSLQGIRNKADMHFVATLW